MKLSVSNLAWPNEENAWCLEQLSKYHIEGIELAPLKVFDNWEVITDDLIDQANKIYTNHGLKVSSLQAITFGASNIALVGDSDKKENFLTHLDKVAYLLSKLAGKSAVFGSPGLRNNKNHDQNELLSLFEKVDNIFARHNVYLSLETVPEYYGCHILNQIFDTDDFIENGKFNNVVRHFDTGCQYLSGDLETDGFISYLSKSKHLHISQIDLNNFAKPDLHNTRQVNNIKEHYTGEWCVLEMSDKSYSRENFLKSLENFTTLFR